MQLVWRTWTGTVSGRVSSSVIFWLFVWTFCVNYLLELSCSFHSLQIVLSPLLLSSKWKAISPSNCIQNGMVFWRLATLCLHPFHAGHPITRCLHLRCNHLNYTLVHDAPSIMDALESICSSNHSLQSVRNCSRMHFPQLHSLKTWTFPSSPTSSRKSILLPLLPSWIWFGERVKIERLYPFPFHCSAPSLKPLETKPQPLLFKHNT